ncbi:hypothetical protein B0H13DRAFT_1908208 [Mycena leptocephala]|nr:hypothetical protein B0H13DRAFT_1908208 [Mycena leptocephala]
MHQNQTTANTGYKWRTTHPLGLSTYSVVAVAAREPRTSRRVTVFPFSSFNSTFKFDVRCGGTCVAGNTSSGIISCPWVSPRPLSGGTCGGEAAVELKKKELGTEGKEDTEEPEAERDGLSGRDGVGEWDGVGWRVWRVRIVSVLVLIDPASIAVGDNDKMGGVRIC